MDLPFPRFPDPYRRRSDVGTATVFLIVLLLIVAMGGIAFVATARVIAPINPASLVSSALSIAPTAGASTPVIPLASTAASRSSASAAASQTSGSALAQATRGQAKVANPNLAEQLVEWKAQRAKRGQDPDDYPAFRQHEIAIGAPDPGPVAPPGFRG